MNHNDAVAAMVEQAFLYVYSDEEEGVVINGFDHNYEVGDEPGDIAGVFWGQGVDSGEDYTIYYSNVDLEREHFFKLTKVEVPQLDRYI